MSAKILVVARLGQMALAGTALGILLQKAVEMVAETLDVEYCKILELLPNGNDLRLVAGVGWQAGLMGVATVSTVHTSQAGFTLKSREPVIVADLHSETRFSGPQLLHDHGVVSGISVIIGNPDDPFGVLGAHTAHYRAFSQDDVQFIQAVANVLAEAIARKQAEEQIRHQDRLMRIANQMARVAGWTIEMPGFHLNVASQLFEMLGFPPGTTLTFDEAIRLYPPGDKAVVESAIMACLNEGLPFDIEVQTFDAAGDLRWVRIQGEADQDENGEVRRAQGAIQDISTQKLADAALHQTERRAQALIENAPDGIVLVGADGLLTYASPSSLKIFGYEGANLADIDPAQFTHPDDLPSVLAALGQIQKDPDAAPAVEYRFRHRNGEWRWVESTFTNLLGDASVNAIVINFRDVHARKQAEIALAESERLRSVILESVDDGIHGLNADGLVFFENRASLRMLGWTAEEMSGRNAHSLIHHHYADGRIYPPEACPIYRTLSDGETRHAENEVFFHKDGSSFPVEYTCSAMKDDADAITGVVVSFRDISERAQIEASLRESEMLHRVTLENISDAIFITDDDGRFTYVCPNTDVIFGYSQAEVEDLGVIENLLGPIPLFDPANLAVQGELQNIERSVLTKAGEQRVVLASVKRVSIGAGTILYTCRDISHRKEAEEKIHFQASLLNAVDSAVIVTDPQGFVIYWNGAAERNYGWTASEAVGQNILMLTPTDQDPKQAIAIMDRLKAGKSWAGEFRVRRKDDSTFPAFVVNSPIVDATGNLMGIIGISNDITERKQAEITLHRNLQELRVLHAITLTCAEAADPDELIGTVTQILSSALYPDHLGVLLLDETAGVIYAHPSYKGVSYEDLQQWQIVPVGHGVTGQVALNGQPQRVADVTQLSHYRNITPTTRSELCVPMMIGGRVIGVINAESAEPDFFKDDDEQLLITVAGQLATALERLRLFAETRQRAEQIDQIMRSVSDGLLLLDDAERLLRANPAGWEFLALLNGTRSWLSNGEDEKKEGQQLTHLGNQSLSHLLTSPPGGQWHEIRPINPDGPAKDRVFEALARPLAAGPTTGGWVFLVREVTRQRQVQEQLQRQERLAAVGQLAAGIAHDFNNLMGTILLQAHLLGRLGNLGPKERERLAVINEQSRHASAMIEQILDFSRRSVLERQSLDLLSLLKEQVKLLQRTLPEHIHIGFVKAPIAADYIVQADPTRIQQIVMNLAINARDAMPNGGNFLLELNRLHLKTGNLPVAGMQPGEWVQLTVSDTGEGMAPEVLEHLFEPFFTTKAPGKGTGLGLAQVYGIVRQHHGHITVESQVGKGASFSIYFPALRQAEMAQPQPSPEALQPGEGRLILLVEDNPSLRAAMSDYLELSGYRVLTAENGQEALALLDAGSEIPVLVLSDVVMPRMGGVALLYALRNRSYKMPIILLTGHPLDEAEMRPLRNQGLAAWLAKPIDLAALARVISQALAG